LSSKRALPQPNTSDLMTRWKLRPANYFSFNCGNEGN
jgi:hypothetical protein